MLRTAYNSGVSSARAHFKIAETVLGGSPGVMPRGAEMSHGTEAIRHRLDLTNPPLGMPYDPVTALTADGNVDEAWHRANGQDHTAPGSADGQFGSETIG